jgi:CRISPR system Cascade subunit CasB
MKIEIEVEVKKGLHSLILIWWKELEFKKADRAEIKRCATIFDIQLLQGFFNLKNRLGELPPEQIPNNEQLALIVGILAHVKKVVIANKKKSRQSQTLGKLMGNKNDSVAVSPLRFRRILQITDLNELYRSLICILPLIGYQIYLHQLVDDLRFWNEKTRRLWAEAYYSN